VNKNKNQTHTKVILNLFVFYTVKCRIFKPQNALCGTITGLSMHR